MNRNETIDLLTLIAGFDQRTVGDGDVMAWHVVATEEHWTWPLARRAAINYHRRGGGKPRITPAHITDAIDEIRATIRRTVLRTSLTPPKELRDDPRAEIAWRREYTQRVVDDALAAWADGQPLPEAPALESPQGDMEPEIEKFIDHVTLPAEYVRREPADPNDRRRLIERARAELDTFRRGSGVAPDSPDAP